MSFVSVRPSAASGEIFGISPREPYAVCLATRTVSHPRAAGQRPVRLRGGYAAASLRVTRRGNLPPLSSRACRGISMRLSSILNRDPSATLRSAQDDGKEARRPAQDDGKEARRAAHDDTKRRSRLLRRKSAVFAFVEIIQKYIHLSCMRRTRSPNCGRFSKGVALERAFHYSERKNPPSSAEPHARAAGMY